jgi:2-polyprenyl-3-methyl-5-hydroxy-6-metoxy-1,4-benzoquinol methylase
MIARSLLFIVLACLLLLCNSASAKAKAKSKAKAKAKEATSLSPYPSSSSSEQQCQGVFGETCNNGSPHLFIDDYHFAMVSDDTRNELLHAALRKAIVANESRVLDVGAGTMLLSMMALELGAKKVTGVEANPTMARVARDVLKVRSYQLALLSVC